MLKGPGWSPILLCVEGDQIQGNEDDDVDRAVCIRRASLPLDILWFRSGAALWLNTETSPIHNDQALQGAYKHGHFLFN
jgi:hypothetical protein